MLDSSKCFKMLSFVKPVSHNSWVQWCSVNGWLQEINERSLNMELRSYALSQPSQASGSQHLHTVGCNLTMSVLVKVKIFDSLLISPHRSDCLWNIHSFHGYLLRAYSLPINILGTRYMSANKKHLHGAMV